MKPGRELDVLIAEKVMELEGIHEENGNHFLPNGWVYGNHPLTCGPMPIPLYSTDIAAAWEVVEKMGKWKFTLTWEFDFGGGGQKPFPYATAIFDPIFIEERAKRLTKAETAPHAICLAALAVV